MESRRTTIQITGRSKHELLKIKGELLKKDGKDRTFDDVIQELVFYWVRGTKKEGFSL